MDYDNLVGYIDRAFIIGKSDNTPEEKQRRIEKLRENLKNYLS